LSRAIRVHIDQNPRLADFEVVQFNEKFGTLRYYYDGGDDFIESLVEEAELETVRELTDGPYPRFFGLRKERPR
jgi:hypothetical protein